MKNHALQAKLSEMESKLLGGKHWMRFVHVVPDADCRFFSLCCFGCDQGVSIVEVLRKAQ